MDILFLESKAVTMWNITIFDITQMTGVYPLPCDTDTDGT